MDEFEYFGLPYVDYTGPYSPEEYDRMNRPSYETPYWIDTINRGIERAAQVATIAVGGYPPYPSYPTPTPQPTPLPQGQVQQQTATQSSKDTVTFSNTTLMLLVGGFLLFTLGKRGR